VFWCPMAMWVRKG